MYNKTQGEEKLSMINCIEESVKDTPSERQKEVESKVCSMHVTLNVNPDSLTGSNWVQSIYYICLVNKS